MPADLPKSLIAEIEEAVRDGPSDRRTQTLRSVTDLFLNDAGRLTDEQIELFGEVMKHLSRQIEVKALIELGERLAPIKTAPIDVIRNLARHAEIMVAGPALAHSERLTDADLLEIARSRGQAHLMAIASRKQLNEIVTDALVDRGENLVLRKAAANSGARFSQAGFAKMMERARDDGALAERIVERSDISPHMLRALLIKATDVVRQRLRAVAPADIKSEIERVLTRISAEVAVEIKTARENGPAAEMVRDMHRAGSLGERELMEFAKANRFDETVAALSLLCAAPIELVAQLMLGERNDPVMILCKSADFQWPTLRAIISGCRRHGEVLSATDLETIQAEYQKLSHPTAQRVLRFWRVREAAGVHLSKPAPQTGEPAAPPAPADPAG